VRLPVSGSGDGLGEAAQGSIGSADGMADEGTRKVLSWRVSNTMDADFCIEALEEALAWHGRPEIFNTDQGSQGGFKWSSQHPLKGSCDAKSKAAVGTGAAVLTWSPTGDRTRREPAVLGGDCGRYGE